MTSIKISKDVLAQEMNGETVLLDLASESYFGQSTMVDTLLEEYEVERETLERDISELLDRLSDAGLIGIS
jgi:hypothetical protein